MSFMSVDVSLQLMLYVYATSLHTVLATESVV